MKIMQKALAVVSAFSLAVNFTAPAFMAVAADKAEISETVTVTDSDKKTPLSLNVSVPDSWTNSTSGWAETDEGATILYKTVLKQNQSFGGPADAKPWNGGAYLTEGSGYIKFWAVRDSGGETAELESEPTPYKYDKTAPDSFSLRKEKTGDGLYIKSDSEVTDTLSAVSFYLVIDNGDLTSKAEIEKRGEELRQVLDIDSWRVVISVTDKMIGHKITVYAVDEAGNISNSSIFIKDTSKPSLNVKGIDPKRSNWYNTLNWSVTTDEGAGIWFKTARHNMTDWGGIDSDGVQKWDPEWDAAKLAEIIPESDHYIHFWAAYDDKDREIATYESRYNFDKTPPKSFEIECSDPVYYMFFDYKVKLSSTLSDDNSGIAGGTYKIGTGNAVDLHVDQDNKFTIELALNDISNNDITFTVKDKAGNERSTVYRYKNDHPEEQDPASVTKASVVKSRDDLSPKTADPFGDKRSKANPRTNDIYVNDGNFIDLELDGGLPKEITAVIDGKEKTFRHCDFEVAEPENDNEKTHLYIAVSKLFEGLTAKTDRHSVSFSVSCYGSGENDPESIEPCFILDKNGDVCTLYYDKDDQNEPKITVTAPKLQTINGKKYYGGSAFSDTISATITDDTALKSCSYSIVDPTGRTVKASAFNSLCKGEKTTETVNRSTVTEPGENTTAVQEEITYNIPMDSYTCSIDINSALCSANGRYVLTIKAEDLAGNENEYTFKFYVDTSAPTIREEKFAYEPSLLKFLSFGIFGKDAVTLTVIVDDSPSGCGIPDNAATLKWNNEEIEGKKGDEAPNGGHYFVFEDLEVGKSGDACFTVQDVLGNKSAYYFTDEDGRLSRNGRPFHLELENGLPYAEIVLPAEEQVIINDEIWYPEAVTFDLIAMDEGSGLNNAVISVKDSNTGTPLPQYSRIEDGIIIDGSCVKFADDKATDKFTKQAVYTYTLDTEGSYTLTADSEDNAGNKASESTLEDDLMKREKTIHIDLNDPEIVNILFDTKGEAGSSIEYNSYGYYFKEDTVVKVYVKDEGVSSGIDYVTLFRREANSQEIYAMTVYATGGESWNAEESCAEFGIEKGFKGQIWAIAADKVASEDYVSSDFRHTSGYRYANGTIVEDEIKHSEVSGITISEADGKKPSNTYRENGSETVFYNEDVPLIITVNDSFSGISEIEWSIAGDSKSGTITVDNEGNVQIDGDEASVISSDRDLNLITSMQFTVTVTSDSNNNLVSVKMTDRSGNSSAATTKSYNIDKTAPKISSTLTSDRTYFNGDQEIKITIEERNFREKDVRFMVNGESPSLTWTTTGITHTASYRLTDDGDYSYHISYTDMAGNAADSESRPRFVIDKTAPVLETNFKEFGTSNAGNYFGIDKISKAAVITITERNFDPSLANVSIMRKDAGSSHDSGGMSAVSMGSWSTDPNNKDKHILTIPFSRKNNDGTYTTFDGVYMITVSPQDLASNGTERQSSAVFEIDFTKPVICERNGQAVKDTEDAYSYLEIFTEKSGIGEGFIPSAAMSDKNLDRIEYTLTVYTPEYANDKELGTIVPTFEEKGRVTDLTEIGDKTRSALYTLPEFDKDGVYSFDLVAVDKAGNRSTICRSTSVMMMKSDVLAYIQNSKKASDDEEGTGWYSLQKDEKDPISKRPDSFSDLEITVFALTDSKTSILLRDQNGKSDDTGITAKNDGNMYAMGVYNYVLPKEFFVENYPEGTNKDLYLWAENTYNGETSHISLAWIRIDAVAPSCSIPDDLKNWKSFTSSTKTFTITDISESLDPDRCKVYDNSIEKTDFTYSEEDGTLSYTLGKGWHDLSFVLVDEAGNTYTVQEVSSIQVGLLSCLWFRVLMGVLAVIAASGTAFILIRKKNSHA